MARQSDDQRTVQMHLLPRSSLALPDLTDESVQACRSLPDTRRIFPRVNTWLPGNGEPRVSGVAKAGPVTQTTPINPGPGPITLVMDAAHQSIPPGEGGTR